MKNVFRTSTGIECGINYQRPLPNLVESHDACLIQKAFLNKQNKSLIAFIKRIICN